MTKYMSLFKFLLLISRLICLAQIHNFHVIKFDKRILNVI